MTITQLEYIIALDRHRHFGKAAAACFIAQPSLSLQVQKLEEELQVEIFSRNNFPVIPTEIGIQIIEQAKKILAEASLVPELIQQHKKIIGGHIKVGIIPTLAPYLLPLFLHNFMQKYPEVKLSVSELTTDKIIRRLKNGTLDAGILATPLQDTGLVEDPLFYEEFVAYVSKKEKLYNKKFLLPGDIDVNKLWLLEEGHCLRSQVINLCALQKDAAIEKHFDYSTGSIETLKRFVEKSQGITLLPELATLDMPASKKQMLRYFKSPAPVREISLVTEKSFIKRKLLAILHEEIMAALPASIMQKKNKKMMEPAL
ncbi:MAG: hydrogen peroxide-inducible s activator [Ferruginibacter sp.]|nr:hydrogen peroxide-inducible s activator [Ferruginibacter sp.]